MTNSKEYNQSYYLDNRDKRLEDRKECRYCGICMSFYPKDYINKHLKTKKHLINIPTSLDEDL